MQIRHQGKPVSVRLEDAPYVALDVNGACVHAMELIHLMLCREVEAVTGRGEALTKIRRVLDQYEELHV